MAPLYGFIQNKPCALTFVSGFTYWLLFAFFLLPICPQVTCRLVFKFKKIVRIFSPSLHFVSMNNYYFMLESLFFLAVSILTLLLEKQYLFEYDSPKLTTNFINVNKKQIISTMLKLFQTKREI